jgi:hypothetical protein
MSLESLLLRQWIPDERRATRERRWAERRLAVRPVAVDRRRRQRRTGLDRRESPLSHLRNVLQILHEVRDRLAGEADTAGDLQTAIRRVSLAVAELERLRRLTR